MFRLGQYRQLLVVLHVRDATDNVPKTQLQWRGRAEPAVGNWHPVWNEHVLIIPISMYLASTCICSIVYDVYVYLIYLTYQRCNVIGRWGGLMDAI